MTFSISDFKSSIQRHGGLARQNLFTVEMLNSDLKFFCKSASLPGVNVTVQDYYPNGFGMKHSIPVSATTGDVNLVFMLDSDHKILSFFHRWMQKVVNYDVSSGIFSSVNDQLPFEFGYKDEYAVTISIKFYSTDLNGYYEYTLYDAFPTQVSPIDVSWDSNDSYATVTVNMAFSNMKVTRNVSGADQAVLQRGSPSERYSRGQGLLQFLNTVGNTAQLINQNSRIPRSIQEAVNSFTRVSNTVSSINNTINRFKSIF
jgi:hypothetical protein